MSITPERKNEVIADNARSAGDTLRSFSSGPAGVVVLRR